MNPWITIRRADGRIEFANGGPGHPASWCYNTIHGCDGGCQAPDFPGRVPQVGDVVIDLLGRYGLVSEIVEGFHIPEHDYTPRVLHFMWPVKEGQSCRAERVAVLGNIKDLETSRTTIPDVGQADAISTETLVAFVKANVPQDWPTPNTRGPRR